MPLHGNSWVPYLKNNIIFGKGLIVFFSLLKVDGLESSRGGVEAIITTKSMGIIHHILMSSMVHECIVLFNYSKWVSNYGPKNSETFLTSILVPLQFYFRSFS